MNTNSNILKPNSPSRLWKAKRRKRVRLPATKRSKSAKYGGWVETPTYGRDFHPKGHSKYEPHIGKKQLARK